MPGWRLLAVYLAVFLALVAVSGLRLRSLTLEGASLDLWLPFLRPLLAATLEMTFLVGAPAVGVLARATGRGYWAVAAFSAVLAAVCLAPLPSLERGKEAGVVAQQILDATLESCRKAPERRAKAPVIGVEWSCPSGAAVTASGRVPVGRDTRFVASSLGLRADLREITLSDLRLVAQRPKGAGELRVTVKKARIRGILPWGAPTNVGSSRRLAALLAGISTLLAGLIFIRWGPLRGGWAFALGAVGGLAAVAVLRSVDQGAPNAGSYPLLALTGPVTIGVAWVSSRAFEHWVMPGLARVVARLR